MRVPNWLNKDIKTPKPFFFLQQVIVVAKCNYPC